MYWPVAGKLFWQKRNPHTKKGGGSCGWMGAYSGFYLGITTWSITWTCHMQRIITVTFAGLILD